MTKAVCREMHGFFVESWATLLSIKNASDAAGSNVFFNYPMASTMEELPVTLLAVTMKGQITLKQDLLRHLGVKPGERIEFDKLPGGELRIKAARATGSIDTFIGRHAGKVKTPLTIEDMNDIAAAGWAGEE